MMPTRISGALDEVLGAGHLRADPCAEGVLVTEGLDRVVLIVFPPGVLSTCSPTPTRFGVRYSYGTRNLARETGANVPALGAPSPLPLTKRGR